MRFPSFKGKYTNIKLTDLFATKLCLPHDCGMECTWAETAGVVKMLEELVMDESKLPVGW